MLKCKHQSHCACSSEIATCIINAAGRRAAQKKKENKIITTKIHVFGRISPDDVLYAYFAGKY